MRVLSLWLQSRRPVDVGVVALAFAMCFFGFVPPLAGLSSRSVAFDGDPHMRNRPVGEVLAALRTLGVAIDDDGRDALPFTVRGSGSVRGGRVVIDASASSQFVSALLLAGARFEDGVDVLHDGKPVPSMPHIAMTVDLLRRHGVEVDDAEPNRWRVAPGPVKPLDNTIEPDLSNAAPFLALAATTGGTVVVRDWPSPRPSPATCCATCWPGWAARSASATTACASRAPDGSRASTPTCTTSAS